MRLVSSAILADREFYQAKIVLSEQMRAPKPLPLSVNGLSDGARDAFLAELLHYAGEELKAPALIFAEDESEARAVAARLASEGISALYYPARDFVLLNISASHDVERERLGVLSAVLSGECVTVVSTPYAALQHTMPSRVLGELSLSLSASLEISPDELSARLVAMGYARVDTVESVGQFARRGGILDVFAPSHENPVRMEFFGDEIDRMSFFDPISQRTVSVCESFSLLPSREVLLDAEAREKVRAAHASLLKHAPEDSRAILTAELSVLENGLDVSFSDRYIALAYPESATLLSYFEEKGRTLSLLFSTTDTKENTEKRLKLFAEETLPLLEKGLIAPKHNRFFADYVTLSLHLEKTVTVYVSSFGNSYNGKSSGLFGFRARRAVSYFDKPQLLREDLKNLLSGYYRTVIVTDSGAEAEALSESLRADGYKVYVPEKTDEPFDFGLLNDGTVAVTHGALSSGFELLVPKIAVLSTLPDEEARRKRGVRRAKRGKQPAGQKIMSYADLRVGDYVVHAVHGIGIFEGIEQIRTDGAYRDYITIRYAGTDSLFLPADRLEMISKYIGAKSEDGSVKLSRLGGGEWQRAKSRAKESAKNIAKELIQLYAERQRREGFAFPPDSDMERDFAAEFEFEETDSQLTAISEIESDMQRPVPMDRLLCGDVGYGKTEVALRAAFKAIVGGKQAAILVPTTILAMQHYQTAISRMRSFPVDIEMLSRLRTPKEQERIKRRLARGEIDLVIGTHILLSKNIAFKDLGLLIVDEEQRFGVAQKEKLKTLASDVDVLTLTATPIPRTLNMAMSGIRDMSVLDEAPSDRHPVQTYVLEYDDVVIGDAVRKELSRGGQVLYLYNNTETIYRPVAKLQALFPEARVTVAHGKMDKEELEDIWQSLVRGEIDILVCTTIVETGVDLPNANTLIIENADRMGLSQLHQLRGRVGRSGRHAYAYFTYRRGKGLTEIAQKRLKAIREFAEFGAGFKIALRDLEIRGAGNLLGAEQHGHIDSIGYDLYVKILNEAILEEKGVVTPPPFEAQVELAVDAYIPESYIATSAERMEMYKKISLISVREDACDVLDELFDRYGDVPRATERLLWVAYARAALSRARISKAEYRDGTLRFLSEHLALDTWSEVFSHHPSLRFAGGAKGPTVTYKLSHGEDAAKVLYELMMEYEDAEKS